MNRLRALIPAVLVAIPVLASGQESNTDARATSVRIAFLRLIWTDSVQKEAIEQLQAGDPAVRLMAAETLGWLAKRGDRHVHEALLHILNDEDRRVRQAIYSSVARIGVEGAADVLVNVLQFDDGKDKTLRAALVSAIDRLGKPAVSKLVALADSGEAGERDRAVEAFLALRGPAGAEALPTLLKNYHLTKEQKAGLVRSVKNYGLDGKQLIAWLDQKDPQLRLAVMQLIADRRIVQAVPRLEKMLQEPANEEEGRAAAKALEKLRQE